MDNLILKAVEEMVCSVKETEEEFIFKTIFSYAHQVNEKIISKKMLKKALLHYQRENIEILELQKQLAEAMELLELAKSDIEDLKDCQHCKFNLLERCPECDEYGYNWQWQYADRYEKLQKNKE